MRLVFLLRISQGLGLTNHLTNQLAMNSDSGKIYPRWNVADDFREVGFLPQIGSAVRFEM